MSVIVNPVTNDITVIVGSGGITTNWDNIEGKPAVVAEGATAAEARALIGAGTSDFDGTYDALVGKPSIPIIPSVMTQAEAEAGVSTTQRTITAQRIAQAITALSPTGSGTIIPISLTSNKTISQSDHKTIQYTTDTSVVIDIQSNGAIPTALGTQIDFFQAGVGTITFSGNTGVTVVPRNGVTSTSVPGDAATLVKLFANTWALIIGG
ncbi:MAG: hypothetical protein ACRDE7_03100 [Sphingobacterium sp.]